MTLHEAIIQLLTQHGSPMTTTEIAKALNKNGWYKKKDGSIITPFQIHGRTKNYAQYFDRDGTTVSLRGQSANKSIIKPEPISKSENKATTTVTEDGSIEHYLMSEENFQPVAGIDHRIPKEPGIYCLRIKNTTNLPSPFNHELQARNHNIIYIGIASQSLFSRLQQELRAKGHGTFFRSIGAILGYRPEKGSLINKSNKRNYTFPKNDELKIIKWINENLLINWFRTHDFTSFEAPLIEEHLPLINIDYNPSALDLLRKLRAECVRIANEE